MSARRAGSTVLSIENTEKFLSLFSLAAPIATAVPGAVVSKPAPRKTTSYDGFSSASVTASSGEYTTLTRAPSARDFARFSP